VIYLDTSATVKLVTASRNHPRSSIGSTTIPTSICPLAPLATSSSSEPPPEPALPPPLLHAPLLS